MTMRKKEAVAGLAVVIPMTAYYALFTLVPLGMLFFYSFTNYNIVKRQQDFIWFKNFIDFFKYSQYASSMVITLFIAVMVVAIGMVLGFLLALLLTKVIRARTFLRTLWYIPALLPLAVVSRFLTVLLSPQGSVNTLFVALGLGAQNWFDSAFWMYFWIIAIVTWKGLGSTALLFIAGLNGVSKEIYEAADIDGATGWNRVIKITLPLIRPMIGFILITGFIGAFNLFEPVMLISNGGPEGATKVIMFMIWDEAFRNNNLGFASALSVLVFIVVLVLTWLNIKVSDNSILRFDAKGGR